MSTQEDAVISLGTRQIDVQRRNLVQMCRLTVKSLIDKSSFEPVDDNSNELINFFAVMEQLLLHRIRPQKKWYGTAEPAHYWDYMRVACRKVSNNCITNIESIENIKTSRGKGRAWLRVALMEKRLAEYFSNALSLSRITKKFYLEGSVMLSEDTGMLCGTLLGLNSIDFSFCLKGDNLELMGPLAIDYSPYLLFQHSGDDLSADGDNQPKLDNANLSSSIMSESDLGDASWVDRFKRLEVKFKNVSEQKGYLEELVRLRQSQLDEATRQRQKLLGTLEHYESESRRERQQLEGVIIELQGQLVAVKEQLKVLQRELASLRARVLPQPNSSSDGDLTALAMREMSGETTLRLPPQIISSLDSDVQSQGSDVSSQLVGGETRSVLTQSASKQETQSLVPLAGSFSSEASFKSGDLQLSAMSKASGESITESQTSKKSMDNAALVASQISPAEDGVVSKEPLLPQNNEIRESAKVTVTRPTLEGNGNQVEQLPSVSVVDDPEVRSSPDGEVSEDRTILAAIVGGPEVTAPDGQEEGKSSDDSSDDGRSPPKEMTVEETSSDNSNGEWTLLPRTEDQQDPASSSSEGLGAPEEVTAEDNSSEQPIEHSDIKEESTQDM